MFGHVLALLRLCYLSVLAALAAFLSLIELKTIEMPNINCSHVRCHGFATRFFFECLLGLLVGSRGLPFLSGAQYKPALAIAKKKSLYTPIIAIENTQET